MSLASYRQLIVWQRAMDLVEVIYELVEMLPGDEKYGLSSQMRRSVVSIPVNIAEGNRRGTRKDYRQFVLISFGSGTELETLLLIAQRLKFLTADQCQPAYALLDSVMKMLNALQQKLRVS